MNDRPIPVTSAFEEGARPRALKAEHCPWCDAAPGDPCLSLMGRKLRHFTHYVKDACPVAHEQTAGAYYCTRTPGHDGPCAAVPWGAPSHSCNETCVDAGCPALAR